MDNPLRLGKCRPLSIAPWNQHAKLSPTCSDAGRATAILGNGGGVCLPGRRSSPTVAAGVSAPLLWEPTLPECGWPDSRATICAADGAGDLVGFSWSMTPVS